MGKNAAALPYYAGAWHDTRNIPHQIMTFTKICIIGIALGVGIKWFALESFTVPTESMSPTIARGVKVWVLKLPFSPKKGDIVSFEKAGESFVKRIVGTPSDSVVQLRGGYEIFKNQTENIKTFYKIPRKGETIYFNPQTFDFYKNIIEKYENVQAGRLFDRIFIGGKEQNQFTFTQNYYFVQGDNIKESIDSRHFGLIAEKCIFGKILKY